MKRTSIIHLTIYLFLFLSLPLLSYRVSYSEIDRDEGSELNWVLKNINQTQLKLNTFSAKMVQIRKTQLLKRPLQSEGLIYFESEGKMLFKVTSPAPLLVLFKDGMVLIHYPDISKVEQSYIGRNILKEFFGIGQSIEELGKHYSIQLGSKTSSDSYLLKLVPKGERMRKYFDSIEVKVNPELWLPERIYYREKNGDWTSIHLEFISINEPLPQNVFSMRFLENYEDKQ